MATAVHIRNLIVTRDSPENKPPFELFWNKAPKLSHLRTFGSEAFVQERGHQQKLDARSFRAKFIGYDDKSTAWLFVSLANGKIIRSRSAKSNETEIPMLKTNETNAPEPPCGHFQSRRQSFPEQLHRTQFFAQ